MPNDRSDGEKRLRSRSGDMIKISGTITSHENLLGFERIHRNTIRVKFNGITIFTIKTTKSYKIFDNLKGVPDITQDKSTIWVRR